MGFRINGTNRKPAYRPNAARQTQENREYLPHGLRPCGTSSPYHSSNSPAHAPPCAGRSTRLVARAAVTGAPPCAPLASVTPCERTAAAPGPHHGRADRSGYRVAASLDGRPGRQVMTPRCADPARMVSGGRCCPAHDRRACPGAGRLSSPLAALVLVLP